MLAHLIERADILWLIREERERKTSPLQSAGRQDASHPSGHKPVDEGPRKHTRKAYGREIEAKMMRAESE